MEPMIGEIRMFGGNFAPRGWAICDGQLLAISQNDALFSILGTTYGGDGRTTFGLPDMRGRGSMHAGNGPGLTDRRLGAKFGTETNTLNINNLASHSHNAAVSGEVQIPVNTNGVDADSPSGAYPGNTGDDFYASSPSPGATGGALDLSQMNITVQNNGGQQPLNNMEPVQVVNYIIALLGIYPSRS